MTIKKRAIVFWCVIALLALVDATAICIWQHHKHTVPWDECSEVYRRYADTPGVNAAYIKDYQVNDTVTVSVTLLEAIEPAGWETLKNDFNIKEFENDKIKEAIESGKDILCVLPLAEQFYNNDTTAHHDIAVASKRDKYVCLFHANNIEDEDYLLKIIYDKIFNSLKTNQSLIQ